MSGTFWTSPGALLLVGGLWAVAIAAGISALLRPRGRPLLDRLEGFLPTPRAASAAEDDEAEVDSPLVASAERSLSRLGRWPAFEERVELARLPISPARLATLTGLVTLLGMSLIATLTGTPAAALVALAIPLGVNWGVNSKVMRQRRLFGEQLAENCRVLASAMRAGHSLGGALAVLVEDAGEPSRTEFKRARAQERLGMPLDQAFDDVARRMESEDMAQLAVVASLQRDAGGDSAEVLDRVADAVKTRTELRTLVRTLTTQGRMSRWIVTALPIGLLAAISVLNPEYIKPLFTTLLGQVMLAVATLMVTAGSIVIGRMVNIEV